MRRVTRRPQAMADILEIWDYIADDDPGAADRWIDRLDAAFNLLATQPLMGRTRPELATGVRSFPFGRYVIFYAPADDGIDVVRVLHGSRDIDSIFDAD
ncbi:MAG: type II toxin-antitoxin system RelE/ParE family toxin [Gammaproteobacteria bacterium]|jgi:toxin ParE1/3/4